MAAWRPLACPRPHACWSGALARGLRSPPSRVPWPGVRAFAVPARPPSRPPSRAVSASDSPCPASASRSAVWLSARPAAAAVAPVIGPAVGFAVGPAAPSRPLSSRASRPDAARPRARSGAVAQTPASAPSRASAPPTPPLVDDAPAWRYDSTHRTDPFAPQQFSSAAAAPMTQAAAQTAASAPASPATASAPAAETQDAARAVPPRQRQRQAAQKAAMSTPSSSSSHRASSASASSYSHAFEYQPADVSGIGDAEPSTPHPIFSSDAAETAYDAQMLRQDLANAAADPAYGATIRDEGQRQRREAIRAILGVAPISDDEFGRIHASHSKLTMWLEMVIFDHRSGKPIRAKGEFKKLEFWKAFGLQPRDLRKVNHANVSENMPAILPRSNSIVLNLGGIDAIIRNDCLVLFEAASIDTEQVSGFIHDLQGRLTSNDETYFELKVLEAALDSVVTSYQKERDHVLGAADACLQSLEHGINESNLKAMLLSRRQLAHLLSRVRGILNTMNALLENDEDMAALFLTDRARGHPRARESHAEAELLLEHYVRIMEEVHATLHSVTENFDATQAVMRIVLDSRRNNLITFENHVNIMVLAISVVAAVAALFGMNLQSDLERREGVFYITGALAWLLAVGCSMVLHRRLHQLVTTRVESPFMRQPGLEAYGMRRHWTAKPVVPSSSPSASRLNHRGSRL